MQLAVRKEQELPRWVRVGSIAAIAVPQVVTGVWGVFAPRHWFDHFPGIGPNLLAAEPPFNAHLASDAGAGFLAAGVAVAIAATLGRRLLLMFALGIYAVGALPHVLYHAMNPAPGLSNVEDFVSVLMLAIGLTAAGVLAWGAWKTAPGAVEHDENESIDDTGALRGREPNATSERHRPSDVGMTAVRIGRSEGQSAAENDRSRTRDARMDAVATPIHGDTLQRTPRGPDQASLPGSIVRAVLYGAAWGGAARLWMRYISEDPEFTISGTSFIIGVPTVIALCSVLSTRSVNWRPLARRPSRVIAGFSTVLLGVAAGILMMPTLLLGGIIWANRKRFPPLLLLPIGVLACAPIVAVVQEIPKGRVILAFPAYLLLLVTFIPVYARIYNPAQKGSS